MNESDLQNQIAAARVYEEVFVPALVGQWAPQVADAGQLNPGQHVLDVGCGTGVLAREAAARVSPNGAVTGVDANPGMLAVATERAPTVEWHQGNAEALPYDDQRFDVVVSQFALMFFANRDQALTEMRRVLKEYGRLAVAVWASLETAPAYSTEVDLFERLAGKDAADALRAPFVLGSPNELAGLISQAGMKDVNVTTLPGVARFPSIRFMVEADLRGWLPLMGVVLSEEKIQEILKEAEQVLGDYATADGKTAFQLSAHIATGRR